MSEIEFVMWGLSQIGYIAAGVAIALFFTIWLED